LKSGVTVLVVPTALENKFLLKTFLIISGDHDLLLAIGGFA
jgi:hypothetical protein